MIFSISLSILITDIDYTVKYKLVILLQIEANIVLNQGFPKNPCSNKCLHYLVSASHDSGLFGTIFLFHEW